MNWIIEGDTLHMHGDIEVIDRLLRAGHIFGLQLVRREAHDLWMRGRVDEFMQSIIDASKGDSDVND